MPLHTTTTSTRGILPDEHGPLVVRPFMTESVAAQVSTVVTTAANRYRIPTVTADPTAAWVAEGAEIPITDPTLAELTVTPAKVAGLTIVSRELADDTNPLRRTWSARVWPVTSPARWTARSSAPLMRRLRPG